MKKIMLLLLILIIITGCSVVRIDTKNIDNIISVVLSKNNTLYNRVGQGYKYYIPRGVSYIESNELNDTLYFNGNYYYLYIDVISYYFKENIDYKVKNDAYYSKKIKNKNGKGYLEIVEKNDMYYVEFFYNYAKIEAIVNEENLYDTVLNASYILSTIKYNSKTIDLMLNDDYFTNRAGKYDEYSSKGESNKFQLMKDDEEEEG